jgi:hypothetical protein
MVPFSSRTMNEKSCLTDHPVHLQREIHEAEMVPTVGLGSRK